VSKRIAAGLFALGCSGLFAAALAAQDASPTVAPDKTDTVTLEVTPLVSETTVDELPSFDALTQEDLSVLTGNVQRPNGIAYFNNFLYIACTGDQTIYETNSETGATRTYIFGLENAHTLYVEGETSSPLIYAPDYLTNELKLIRRGATVQTVAEGFEGPWGIVPLDEQQFFISNLLGDTVDIVSREGERQTWLEDLSAPAGLAWDNESDTLYIGNNGSTRRAVMYATMAPDGTASEPEVLVSGLQNTTGIQLASDGNLYFAYALGTRGVVGRVDPEECRENGGCTNEQVEIVVYTEIEAPLAGLAISPDMRLFVHTMFSPSVYWGRIPS
jgi:hypothetical protein